MLNEIKSAFLENKLAIYISIAILFISLILGYFLEPYCYSYLNPVVEDLTRKVQEGVLKITFADIFSNNFKIILEMFALGIVFCFSALILAFNGFFVGYYVATSSDLFQVLMYIIPHGIFEFSSIVLACAASFVLFNFIYKFFKGIAAVNGMSLADTISKSFDEYCEKLKQALILFGISVVLMIIAGVIEAYLTIPIAQFVLSI